MNVVSNAARVSISEIQTMMRRFKKKKDKKIALFKTDEITIDFKSMKFRFIEFNRNVKCQRVINAIEKKIVFAFLSFELRIVLRIL
jgi:UDP-N-acetylglucosamine pyrophosphorylase